MKRYAVLFAGLFAVGVTSAVAETAPLRTFCRFVPERADDFAWENDQIAFRAYGPAARNKPENSGFDCWLKRVDYPMAPVQAFGQAVRQSGL